MTEEQHAAAMDALTRVCPGCGALADWPDCGHCGYDFTAALAPSGIEAEAENLITPREPEHLRVVPLGDLMTCTPPAPRFVVEPIIPRRVATLLSAHGGSGKSVLALAIAAHVAAGQSFAGFEVITGRAVFVSLEDPGDVVRWRLRRIVDAYKLDAGAVLDGLAVLDGSDIETGLAVESWNDGRRELAETDAMADVRKAVADAALIVIDNASDAADFDENVRRYVRRFVRMLVKLARDNDAGLLLLAHIDKSAARYGSAGESYSGSTAWHNSARSRLALLASDAGAVELVHEKANLTAKSEPRLFAWGADGVLMPTTAEAARQGAQAATALLAVEDAEHVLSALVRAQKGGCVVSVARSGSHSARTALVNCGLPDHLAKGSASRFYRALDLLLAERRAVVEAVTTADRKTRERLLPAPDLRQSVCARQSPTPPSKDWRTGCAPVSPVAPVPTGARLAQLAQPPKWAGPDPKDKAA